MPEQFLHGVEIIEFNDGARPIQTVKSSVIGLVGTAPNAKKAQNAKTTVAHSTCEFEIQATESGVVGNGITLMIDAGDKPSVVVMHKSVVVTMNFNTEKKPTANDVKKLIDDSKSASALLSISVKKNGEILPFVKFKQLSQGADEAFPLNQPTLVTGNRSALASLGSKGTLPSALAGIFDQVGAMVVIVRVEEDKNPIKTTDNIIGGVDPTTGENTGIYALLSAENETGVKPRILIAPGFSDEITVTQKLIGIAEQLHAVIIADAPNLNKTQAVAYRANFGSDRLYLVEPAVTTGSEDNAEEVPASPYVAGLIAKTDNNDGFWFSPSNREINGISGTSIAIDFELGNTNCTANYLNENDVATIIRKDGFRLWGNRTTSSDPRFAFLCVRRTADMINESLQKALLWAVDKPINENYIDSIVESVNAYLRHLRSVGAIISGQAFANPELNSPEEIEQGKITIDFDFTPTYPAEHISFRSIITNQYLKEII